MSLTQASTGILRHALAPAFWAAGGSADNVSVVKEALAQLGLCRADVRPPSRPLPADVKAEISGILNGWGLR